MKQRAIFLAVLTLVVLTGAGVGVADAVPLTLVGPIQSDILGPQSTSNPCIIAATQCQQPAGFGFNNFTSSGAISAYNMYSTTPTATVADGVQGTPYTASQITDEVGDAFFVAIDVNTSNEAGETLQLFEVIDTTTNTVLYNYVGPTPIGNIANNGNGFGDWALGIVDLSGVPDDHGILFHASWDGASAGGESFFLVNVDACPDCSPTQTAVVPEPATLLLLGSGLAGAGIFGRKRLARQQN